MNKAILSLIFSLVVIPSAFADQNKSFECEVDTFTGNQPLGMGWKSLQLAPIRFTVAAKAFQGHDEGFISKTIELGGDMEIVFDLTWKSGSLANDDITNIPGASMALVSRLQKVNSNGSASILDMSRTYETPSQLSQTLNKFFISEQLNDTTGYSAVLKSTGNRKSSNSDISHATDSVNSVLIYQLSCSTSIK